MRAFVRPLYMNNAAPFIGRMQLSMLDLTAKATDSMTINNDLFFTVGGGQTVTVTAMTTRSLVCQANTPAVPEVPAYIPYPGTKPPMYFYLFAGYNYDFEINPKFMYDTGNGNWEELDMTLVGNTHDSTVSDYHYWVWPSNNQIKAPFGTTVGIWENLREMNDVCSD